MKAITFCLLFLCAAANAQKGAWFISGNIGYYSDKYEHINGVTAVNKTFSLTPKIGYNFTDHWALGIDGSVSRAKTEYSGNDDYIDNRYRAGAFVRYTKPLNTTFSFFADLGTGWSQRRYGNTPQSQGNGYYFNFTPAVSINIGSKLYLNFGIGSLDFQHLNIDSNSGNQNNDTFSSSFGSSYTAGLMWFF